MNHQRHTFFSKCPAVGLHSRLRVGEQKLESTWILIFFVGENVCPDGIGVYDPAISAATTTAALPSAGCFWIRGLVGAMVSMETYEWRSLFIFFYTSPDSIMFDE